MPGKRKDRIANGRGEAVRARKRPRPAAGGRRQPLTEEERKAMEARRARKERNIREQELAAASRVSYVKKPLAERSKVCMGLLAAALLLGGGGLYEGYATRGNAPFAAGGLALCSLLCSVAALGYGLWSFAERDRNYLLAKIGVGAGAFLTAAWTGVMILGLRG